MNKQSRLMVLKRTPLNKIEGYSPKCSGSYINCTHANKGKVYAAKRRAAEPVTGSTALSFGD